MIRHILILRWKKDFPEERKQEWLGIVQAMPAKIDVIRSLSVGRDVVQGERSWDYGIVADFDTLEDVKTYQNHPDHLPALAISGPNTEAMASIDFEF